MSIVAQLIVNGLIAGAIYALIATGFSLIYNIKKLFHIAHGAVYTVSAFIGYTFVVLLDLNLVASVALTLIIAAILGILTDKIVYRPLRSQKHNEMPLLLASFGVFILLESLVLLFFGADVKTFGFPITQGYDIFGAIITKIQIIILAVAIASFILLQLFLKRTRLGKALRSVSDNKEIASTLGINVEKTTMVTFAIGSVLAGVAGILIGIEQNLEPSMGFIAILKGFTAAIIGGLGNVSASVLGGFLLGIVENLGIWYLPSGYKDAIAFIILIIFLIFRPRGLLGVKTREESGG